MKDHYAFMSPDYYQLLEITANADIAEIRKAYRKLARQYHPDVNTSSTAKERFQEVTKAYETLSNPDARQKYDALIMSQSVLDPTMFIQADLPILKLSLPLTMEQAYTGGKFTLKTIVSVTKNPCKQCNGKGVYIDTQSGFPTTEKCSCQEAKEIKVKVDVPAHITSGTIITGSTRFKIPYKDIQVEIQVQENENFTYNGEVFLTLPINMFDLIQGTTIEVPTFTGNQVLTIQPQTQPDEIIVLEDTVPIKIKFAPYLPKLSTEQIQNLRTFSLSD